jgi:hypothetical protein
LISFRKIQPARLRAKHALLPHGTTHHTLSHSFLGAMAACRPCASRVAGVRGARNRGMGVSPMIPCGRAAMTSGARPRRGCASAWCGVRCVGATHASPCLLPRHYS